MDQITIDQVKRQCPLEAFKQGLFSVGAVLPGVTLDNGKNFPDFPIDVTFDLVDNKGNITLPSFTTEYIKEKFEERLTARLLGMYHEVDLNEVDVDPQEQIDIICQGIAATLTILATVKYRALYSLVESVGFCFLLLEEKEYGNAYIEAFISNMLLSRFEGELWQYNWSEWSDLVERYIHQEISKKPEQERTKEYQKIEKTRSLIEKGFDFDSVMRFIENMNDDPPSSSRKEEPPKKNDNDGFGFLRE